jgi:hypothetical protein
MPRGGDSSFGGNASVATAASLEMNIKIEVD